MKKIPVYALLFCSLFVSTIVEAASRQNIEKKATQLMAAGEPQAAYNLLEGRQKKSPQMWFVYGMAASKSGHFQEAEYAFKEVLRLDPQSHRAKLELATVLANSGDWPESRRLLLDVKATKPPAQVIQNIDRYLALIDEQEAQSNRVRIQASIGILYDSNVNNGPTVDVITMFGLPFTLSDDAKAQSDKAYSTKLEADYVAKLSPQVSWQSNATMNWVDYFRLDQFDTLSLTASTGPVFHLDHRSILSIPAIANAVSYTDQGKFYSSSFGTSPQIRFKLTDEVALNFNANIDWKQYIYSHDRDTFSYVFSPGIDVQTCGKGTVRFGGSVGRDKSGVDTYSNDNWGLNASLFCPLGSNMAFSLFGNYSDASYDAREIFYTYERHDQRTTLGLNLQYAHKPTGLDGIFGITWTDNESNLPIYDYNKVQVTATVKKRF